MVTHWIVDDGYPVVLLTCAMAAWWLWYANPTSGWTFGVALAPVALRLLYGRSPLRPTPLDLPVGVFLLTALVGVWAAYDRSGRQVVFPQFGPVGWRALWGLVLAALSFYAIAGLETGAQLRWATLALASIGAGASLWFAASNDWTANPAELDVITRWGVAVQSFLPKRAATWPNANILGGVTATLMPFSLLLVEEGRRLCQQARWGWVACGLVTGCTMLGGLILTASRGAWMGIGSGLALALVWQLAGLITRGRQRPRAFAVAVGLAVLAAGALAVLFPPLRVALGKSHAISNRLGIFREAMLLLRDYPFTGFGLGEFALVHSTYALMIHVPILPYAHSLYLDIALGQGLLGLLVALSMLGLTAWFGLRALASVRELPSGLTAGLFSLAVMVAHGFVDDPLYSSWAMPLLWVPAGFVVAGYRAADLQCLPLLRLAKSERRILRMSVAIVLALLAFGLRRLSATWYANLGAIYQTRAELSRYDYKRFDDPTLDEIRRTVDLSTAERFFVRALALNPGQVTARTRLAQIALSRGQYDQALDHAQAAWEAGYRDRVTRLALGDALVAASDVDMGVEVVRGLDWAEGRLDGQGWYRYWLGQDYRRAADAWRAVVALNPQNQRAAGAAEAAEARLASR